MPRGGWNTVKAGNAAPCYKCTAETGRSVGCHDHCERYLSWKTEEGEKRAAVKKKKAADQLADSQKREGIRRSMKFRKEHGVR